MKQTFNFYCVLKCKNIKVFKIIILKSKIKYKSNIDIKFKNYKQEFFSKINLNNRKKSKI